MKNPLELQSFVEWLEKQPADKPYDFTNSEECALGLYAKWLGMSPPQFYEATANSMPLWPDTKLGFIACTKPWTFGAALERAKEAEAFVDDSMG